MFSSLIPDLFVLHSQQYDCCHGLTTQTIPGQGLMFFTVLM
jgi:hypothetical protein